MPKFRESSLAKTPPIEIPYRYKPRSYQRPFFEAFTRGIRRFVLVWHRKSGKDITSLNFLIARMLERAGVYWYVLPSFEQAKDVIWYGSNPDEGEYDPLKPPLGATRMLDHFPPPLVKKVNNADLMVELKNGSIFKLIGSDNPDRTRGPNPLGVVFSEFALQIPDVWEAVSPILTANRGWAVFNSTPRGRNYLFKIWEAAQRSPDRWYTSLLTVDDTRKDSEGESNEPVVSQAQIQQLREDGHDEDFLQQEYFCSFYGSHTGSYYGKILSDIQTAMRHQVREVPWEPTVPVFTGWDIGVGDATAIWFAQLAGREIHVIDYEEAQGEGLPYYARLITSKPYSYSNHWVPHDADAREFGTGQSRIETARGLGLYFRTVPRLPIDDGIDNVRATLQRCWFDRNKCDQGLRALQNYTKEWNQKMQEFKRYPKHDKWSHGADAFRYLCLGIPREDGAILNRPLSAETEFDIFDGKVRQ